MRVLVYLKNNQGVTLIELIVAMVVISVALAGVMTVINYTTLHSADPVLRQQSIAIAEAYMEEIVLKDYFDPGDYPDPTLCVNPGDCEECPDPEANREDYDNVCDYNGLNGSGGAVGQEEADIPKLDNYIVKVEVLEEEYGSEDEKVDGLKIIVTVTDPANEELTLTGYRTNY